MLRKQIFTSLVLLILIANVSLVSAEAPATLAELLVDSRREVEDKIRDRFRKPEQVVEFLNIQPGMKILELYAAGGYYTVILASAVGDEGAVFAQNSPRALRFEEDRAEITAGEALTQKISALEITNVIRIDERLNDIHFEPESLDMLVIFQVFHDYFNRDPERAAQMLKQVKNLLKPGGTVGLIDHYGLIDRDNLRLHRIPKNYVTNAFIDEGFVLLKESDLLRNKNDSQRRPIFDPSLGRNTDRFLILFQKP